MKTSMSDKTNEINPNPPDDTNNNKNYGSKTMNTDDGANIPPDRRGQPGEPDILPFPTIEQARVSSLGNLTAAVLIFLVTGLRRWGIGHAIVRRLTRDGHVAYVIERDSAGEEVAREILAAGGRVQFILGDAADEKTMEAVMDRIHRDHGRLDGVVANAGWAGPPGRDNLRDLDAAGWEQLWRANFLSAAVTVTAAIKRFFTSQPSGGRCVFMGSVSGRAGHPGQVAYGAAKAALSPLNRSIAADHGRKVSSFLLVLGAILTQSPNWGARQLIDKDYAWLEGLAYPSGRLATADEVADLVAWLLTSPEAALLSGTEPPADFGSQNVGYLLPEGASLDRDAKVRAMRRLLKDKDEEAA